MRRKTVLEYMNSDVIGVLLSTGVARYRNLSTMCMQEWVRGL